MLVGLIGKPNVGKSTFFKAATLAEVLIANYPFATIKPNHGVAYVKIDCIDKEFKTQCMPRTGFCINHIRFVPIDLMDVAGLVKGASEGKGLGNQFLDDLRQADAFIQVVDLSGMTNEEGKPAENYYPGNDIKMIEDELDLWYSGVLKKVWKTFARQLETSHENFVQAVYKQFSGLKVDEEMIKKIILRTKLDTDRPAHWTDEQVFEFARELRIESKPMIIAGNKSDTEKAEENYKKITRDFPHIRIIPCSADSELALREAAKAELIEYIPGERDFKTSETLLVSDGTQKSEISGVKKELKKLNDKQKGALELIRKNVLSKYEHGTGVQQILNYVVFDFLRYLPIFPAGVHKLADSQGNILPDCYLLPPGSTALDFAFKLHTDLGKNFIKAIDARTGKAVGKEYKLKFRDALEIITR